MGLSAMPWKCPECRTVYAPYVRSCDCQVEKAKDIPKQNYWEYPGMAETRKCPLCGKVHVMGEACQSWKVTL